MSSATNSRAKNQARLRGRFIVYVYAISFTDTIYRSRFKRRRIWRSVRSAERVNESLLLSSSLSFPFSLLTGFQRIRQAGLTLRLERPPRKSSDPKYYVYTCRIRDARKADIKLCDGVVGGVVIIGNRDLINHNLMNITVLINVHARIARAESKSSPDPRIAISILVYIRSFRHELSV